MKIIEKYFNNLTPKQKKQFEQLDPLYRLWNNRINVISRKDIDHLYLHHVLHSLSIALIIPFKPGTVVVDAGTGGGFPGIPLAILFPECKFILSDSIAKKVNVVKAIADELALSNCDIRNSRVEDLREKAEFVVTRAVAPLPVLMKWVTKIIVPNSNHPLKNGVLALKGGDLKGELKGLETISNVYPLKDYFEEVFFETKVLVHVTGFYNM